jgi:hypothetical protein
MMWRDAGLATPAPTSGLWPRAAWWLTTRRFVDTRRVAPRDVSYLTSACEALVVREELVGSGVEDGVGIGILILMGGRSAASGLGATTCCLSVSVWPRASGGRV